MPVHGGEMGRKLTSAARLHGDEPNPLGLAPVISVHFLNIEMILILLILPYQFYNFHSKRFRLVLLELSTGLVQIQSESRYSDPDSILVIRFGHKYMMDLILKY